MAAFENKTIPPEKLEINTSYMRTGWLWLVGSLKLQVAFAKEAYKRDDILQATP